MNWIPSKVAANDDAVKVIFDHVRNLGIVAVVGGAALWKTNNMSPGPLFYFDCGIVAMLAVLALFLFAVNQAHGFRKLRDSKAIKSEWMTMLLANAYSLVAVTIAFAVVGVKL